MPSPISDSRLALYEGLIALAWTDGVLARREEELLRSLIDGHTDFSDDQRRSLHQTVSVRLQLGEIWPRMTDARDRARFLDLADVVIKADGVIDEAEDDIYSVKLSRHLGTLDIDTITRDLDDVRLARSEADREQAEADRAYAKRFGLLGFLHRLFGRDDKDDARRSA